MQAYSIGNEFAIIKKINKKYLINIFVTNIIIIVIRKQDIIFQLKKFFDKKCFDENICLKTILEEMILQ